MSTIMSGIALVVEFFPYKYMLLLKLYFVVLIIKMYIGKKKKTK